MSAKVMAEPKSEIRERIKRLRAEASAESIAVSSVLLQKRVLGLEEFTQAKTVGCYMATAKEANTTHVIAACADKDLCLPAFDANAGAYRFVRMAQGVDLVAGPLGILEPKGGEPVPAAELDLVLVPGLAFDEAGNRLGHGAGHYDRLLADAETVFKVGLAFEFQVVESIIAHEHDVAMNAVITNARVMRVMKQDTR